MIKTHHTPQKNPVPICLAPFGPGENIRHLRRSAVPSLSTVRRDALAMLEECHGRVPRRVSSLVLRVARMAYWSGVARGRRM